MKENIIANVIGRFWSLFSNFIFVPLYIHFLGFESYSVISFTLVIAGIMAVLDAGLTSTILREFARTDNQISYKLKTLKTLEFFLCVIIVVSVFILICSSTYISQKWINLSTIAPDYMSFLFKIVSFELGVQIMLKFYIGGLLGIEKQIKANTYQIIWSALRNGAVLLILFFKPNLTCFFIWQLLVTLFMVFFIRSTLYRTLYRMNIIDSNVKFDITICKSIWKFAGGMLLISLVASFNTQIDKLIISKLLPVENLGYYTLASSLSMVIISLINPISIAVLPRFTALNSEGNINKISELYDKINTYVSIIVFSCFAIFFWFSKDLIWIWTNNIDIANNAFNLLPIFAFTASMLSIVTIPYNIAIANGYTKLNNIIGVVSLLITVPGYWIFIEIYGAIGAASLFCIVQTVISIIYIYIINKKFINRVEMKKMYIEQFLLPLVSSVLITYIFTYIPNYIHNNRILLFLWIGLTFIVNIFFLLFALSNEKANMFSLKRFINSLSKKNYE